MEKELEEPPPPSYQANQQNQGKPPTPKKIPKTTPDNHTKVKDKMPSLVRTTPDPLKQIRQKQAGEAKLLVAQNR